MWRNPTSERTDFGYDDNSCNKLFNDDVADSCFLENNNNEISSQSDINDARDDILIEEIANEDINNSDDENGNRSQNTNLFLCASARVGELGEGGQSYELSNNMDDFRASAPIFRHPPLEFQPLRPT